MANHILNHQPRSEIVLVGRNAVKARKAVERIRVVHSMGKVGCEIVDSVWNPDCPKLQRLINNTDCVIHTAGPYADCRRVPLQLSLASPTCRAYVDVSDPLPFGEKSLLLGQEQKPNLTGLVSAGAFPGMSNVLAVEAIQSLQSGKYGNTEKAVQDLRFQYFTAGLGGSGPVNLYITNLGFGEPVARFCNGELRFCVDISGLIMASVDFFLPSNALPADKQVANASVKRRVGTQSIFAWPFPEAATVPRVFQQSNGRLWGESTVGMGTAPQMWTLMLEMLVRIVPRQLWRQHWFSKALANFSEPLVAFTDLWLRWMDKDSGLGETHAMRIDITGRDGFGLAIIQAHDSFRQCVGQSCAEFAMDCLAHPSNGVFLPEQRYWNSDARDRIVRRLTTIPGTFCYTGPVEVRAK